MGRLSNKIKTNERLKLFVHHLLMHPIQSRPRLWLRLLQVFYLKRGKRSIIYRSVRKDLVPFRQFSLGSYSVVEDFSILNNGVGDILIGNRSRIGIGSTVIGPVFIGDNVKIAQHVTLSGLNHNYLDVDIPIASQGIRVQPITIEEDVWIGANSVVLAGITIGKHSVIGAGSVVNRDIPPFSVAVGNPVKIVKQYDFEKKEWMKTRYT